MIRAVLLSTEQNIISLVEAERDKVDVDFVEMRLLSRDDAQNIQNILVETGAELAVLYGVSLPEIRAGRKRQIPAVNIRLSAADMLKLAGTTAKLKAGCAKIGVVAPENALNRELDTAALTSFGVHVFIPGSRDAIYETVADAVRQKCSVIAGCDEDTANAAKKLGAEYISLTPGRESILRALYATEKEVLRLREVNFLNAKINAITNINFGGCIFVDRRGMITGISETAKHLLNCRSKTVISFYLLNIFDALDKEILDSVLEKGEHIFNHVAGARNNHFLVNIEPLLDNGVVTEAVVSFRKWEEKKHTSDEQSEHADFRAHGRFSDFVYTSYDFNLLIKRAKLAAYTDAPILLYGERGTDKRGFGRRIHNESSRYKMNYFEVECNAWEQEKLVEMLFGATDRQEQENQTKSILEIADGGTLFLDHVDTLSQELQYRVCTLIKGQLRMPRDGFNYYTPNIRVIAATDKDLRKMVAEGKFRSDLYYALSVVTLELPPLRECPEDVRYMAEIFIERYADQYAKPVHLSESAYECMCEYNWPGNMHQLEFFCERLVLAAQSRNINEALTRSELNKLAQFTLHEAETNDIPEPKVIDEEARRIVDALARNNGSKTLTAAELGISKTTLWRRMQKFGITTGYSV